MLRIHYDKAQMLTDTVKAGVAGCLDAGCNSQGRNLVALLSQLGGHAASIMLNAILCFPPFFIIAKSSLAFSWLAKTNIDLS